MPDVTLTLAAEDQASGILDRIVNSLESLNDAVADQTGVYSEFQQQVLRRQEAANAAVQERVDNEKKAHDSVKEILDRTERLYKEHAQAIEGLNRKMTGQEGSHDERMVHQQQATADAMKIKQLEDTVKKESDIRKSDFEDKKDHVDANKHQRRMEYQDRTTRDKTNIKQLEDTVKKDSDIRKSGFESQKDQNDENKHNRRMAYQEQITSDRARLRALGTTASRESDIREGAQSHQEHMITAEGHARRMEYQQQVTADEKSLKQLSSTIKEEDTKVKRSLENRKNTIDKNQHERKMALNEQVVSDTVMLKQLDSTIKKEDATRKRGLENRRNIIAKEEYERKMSYADKAQEGKEDIERLRQQGRKELQIMRQQQRERERLMSGGMGGRRGRGGVGGASEVFKGVLYADFFGVGIQEIRALAGEILQATIKIQGMIFGLQAVEGSAEKAAEQLDRIIDIAKLPGIQLEPAIKATVTLRALKLEGELVERTIKAIGNALATLGREGELGGVVLALSQIVGKGKIHAEEINQIAERLPLIRGILVEEFGTANTEVLQKMELEIEDFVERITQGLERLPKVATQIGTSFKNLQNQIFLFTAQIGTFFKEELMDVIDWVTDRLEGANAALKYVNKRQEELAKQQKVIDEAQKITIQTDVSTGISDEMSKAAQEIQRLYNQLDIASESGMERYNRSMQDFREKFNIEKEGGVKDILAQLSSYDEMRQIQSQRTEASELDKYKLYADISQAEADMQALVESQKEAMDALSQLSYEDLKKQTLVLDQAIRDRTKFLNLSNEDRMSEYSQELEKVRNESKKFGPVYGAMIYSDQMGELAEKYILSPEQEQEMQKELESWKNALIVLGKLSPEIMRKHREKLKEASEKAAEAAAVELEIYNDKISKLVSTEIVPELDPSLEQKIKRVAESADLAVGIEAKVLGLQEQFNAAVGVGLDGLLRTVDNQIERDMNKIANNIKPIAERLKPEIAALKTKAEREAEYDKVLADIRTQMETVAELHKQTITEYYNSMVALEVTFKKWLSDSGGGTQIPTQLITRIDKLAESQMIQDAIGLQMQGLEEPFNRVREYALETLTRTIQGDTENQLIKLREDVLKIAKATHPDFHTFTPERQTEIFSELFEQRAPAINASEKVLLDITSDRFNAILDIHLEFQKWYQDTVGKDTIAPELESMVSKVTSRSDFGEAVQFRVEGFETTFQHERGRMIQGMVQQLQKDTQRALQGAAQQANKALVAHEDYTTMTPDERVSEWDRIYTQLKAPIQAGMGVDVKGVIEHFDKIIEVQTVYNEWLRNTSQTPIISDTDMSRLRRAIQSDEVQMGIEFELAGMTTTFQDVKKYALESLVDSINEDAQKQIAKEAENVSAILMTDPAVREMSRQDIQNEIKKIHDKRIDVINIGRDLAIKNVQAEFENLSRQETIFRRWLSQNTGQTKMQREISEDVQKVIRGGDVQKAFEPESRFEIMSHDADEIINKGLQDLFKQIDRDSQIDLEKRMEGAGAAIRSRFGRGGELEGLLEGGSGDVFMGSQLDQFKQEQEAIIMAQNELRKTEAERIFGEEIQREKEAHSERQNVKRGNDRIDVLEDNRIREQLRQVNIRYQQSVEDSALSAANNVISAWQQVSQQTDTMVDDVVGAVATIALQVTEMLLTIQRTSAASSAAGQATGLLGQFATGLGVAGIALGAAATVYSFIDQRNESESQRNNLKGRRPTSLARR